jgi:hypothetical protein
MSGPRKVVEGLRAVGVMVGGPLILLLAVAACVRSALRSLSRGQLPSAPAALGTTAFILYAGPVRRWMRNWGAEHEQATGTEPVHAIEIDAPAERVWPWLAQLGQDRAGFYSYEWLENLAGCRMRNADRIHPEWQHREIGEKVMLHPLNGLPVSRFEPGREIALEGWGSFAVEPLDGEHSRVVCRGEPHDEPLFTAYYTAFVELPHFLMERRMLLGIKERAERAAPRPPRARGRPRFA